MFKNAAPLINWIITKRLIHVINPVKKSETRGSWHTGRYVSSVFLWLVIVKAYSRWKSRSLRIIDTLNMESETQKATVAKAAVLRMPRPSTFIGSWLGGQKCGRKKGHPGLDLCVQLDLLKFPLETELKKWRAWMNYDLGDWEPTHRKKVHRQQGEPPTWG